MKQLTLFIFFFITILMSSQDLKSLKQKIVNQSNRDKIETYLDIANLPIPRDSAIVYLNKALETANKINFDTIYPIQFAKSVSYYVQGDIINAKIEIKKGFKTYQFTKHPKATIGHINMLLGVFNEAINEVDSAKYYYKKVIDKLQNETTNKAMTIIASTYINLGNLYLKTGKYKEAIAIYIKSEKLNEKAGEVYSSVVTLNNIANCYKELKNYDKALKYFNEALTLEKNNKDIRSLGSIYIGLGEVYLLNNQYDVALKYLLKAEIELQSIGSNRILVIAYNNIATTYLNKNDFTKAKLYANKALKSINKVDDPYTKISVWLTIAKIYSIENQNNKANKMIDKAVFLSKSNNYQNLIKESLVEKIAILKKLKKTNTLSKIYDELLILNDSIINKDKIKSITEIETKYQTEKKEKENLQLKAEKTEQALLLEKEAKTKQYFAFGLLASLLTLGVFGFYYQQNKKQKKIIENLQKDLHHRVKNNLAIIDSLIEDIKDEFDNEKFTLKLTDLQNRIDSINEVHQQLYQNTDITNLKFKKYVEKLANNVQSSFNQKNIQVNNNINDSFTLDVEKSFPIGLIINEFLTNSFKYAFTDKENGVINVSLKEVNKNYLLSLSDNGKGLPKDLDISKLNSFGIDVMQLLSKQLKGTFKIDGTNGVNLQIEFPKI